MPHRIFCFSFFFFLLLNACSSKNLELGPSSSLAPQSVLCLPPQFVGEGRFMIRPPNANKPESDWRAEDLLAWGARADKKDFCQFSGRSLWSYAYSYLEWDLLEGGHYKIKTQGVHEYWLDGKLYYGEPYRENQHQILNLKAGKLRLLARSLALGKIRPKIELLKSAADAKAPASDLPPRTIRWSEINLHSTQLQRVRYQSRFDDSEQYFAIKMPSHFSPLRKYALLFSLHGAHVEAGDHLKNLQPKDWAILVAPSGRGPQGGMWQGLARLDVLELRELFLEKMPVSPEQIYIQGHSMGGQGVLHLASHHPDLFSGGSAQAAWIDRESYLPSPRGPSLQESPNGLLELIQNKRLSARHSVILKNARGFPLFLSSAEKDVVVPLRFLTELKKLATQFKIPHQVEIHKNETEHYCKGNSGIHWCTDFPQQYEWLLRQERPQPTNYDYVFTDLGLHRQFREVEVLAPEDYGMPSEISVRCDLTVCRVRTKNIQAWRWHLGMTAKKKVQWENAHVLPRSRGDILEFRKIESVAREADRIGSWQRLFVGPLKIVVSDDEALRVGRNLQWVLARFAQKSVELWDLREKSFSRRSAKSANLLVIGSLQNFPLPQLLEENAFQFSDALPCSKASKPWPRNFSGWVLRPSPWSKSHWAGVWLASEAKRLDHFLRWGEAVRSLGYGVPDFIFFSEKIETQGLAGAFFAGSFDADWNLNSDWCDRTRSSRKLFFNF